MADNSPTPVLDSQLPTIQENPQPQTGKLLGRFATFLLGCYLVLFAVVLAYLLMRLWPVVEGGTTVTIGFLGEVSPEMSLILLVIVAGALGSFIHAATSFTTYVGNRCLTVNWIWWYILRALIGMALALLFYFLIRGGFLSGSPTDEINPYGIAASAGLVGLCSKQATDKLVEVFDTFFKTNTGTGDHQRGDKLPNKPIDTTTQG